MTKTMKVEGPLHVICQCDKCKPQISFNAEVIGYVEPQRTWVGLTKQQQLDIFAQSIAKKRSEHEHYIAIEQALKERNQ